jgi:hypothetical protein
VGWKCDGGGTDQDRPVGQLPLSSWRADQLTPVSVWFPSYKTPLTAPNVHLLDIRQLSISLFLFLFTL